MIAPVPVHCFSLTFKIMPIVICKYILNIKKINGLFWNMMYVYTTQFSCIIVMFVMLCIQLSLTLPRGARWPKVLVITQEAVAPSQDD